jgi:hypothetical protein
MLEAEMLPQAARIYEMPSRTADAPQPKKTHGFHRLIETVIRLLTETDTTLAEFGSSLTLLLVGVILLQPGAQLSLNVPLFELMRAVMPEPLWALASLTLGCLQSWGNLRDNLRARRWASFSCVFMFGFIAALGASVHPLSVLGSVMGAHAVVQVIVYLRLGVRGAS